MTDTHAHIASKGLDSTGVTEELAAELFNKVGTHLMAIVDLQVVDRSGPNVKDKRKVHLIIDGIEPATTDDMAEHLRELSRVGYLNRAHANGTRAINEELNNERTVADVMAAGAAHKPHPFLPVDASEENPICDVCGKLEATPVHSEQETLPDGDDETEDESELVDVDPAEPHEFEQGPDDSCLHCGRAAHDDFATDFVDSQHGDQPEDPDDWSYPAPEGTVEPVEYDERPNAAVIAKQLHIHVAGDCIKNRDGQLCTPVTTVPDPFTAPA